MDHSAYDVDERRWASVIIDEINELAWKISWIDVDALSELLQSAKDIKEHYEMIEKDKKEDKKPSVTRITITSKLGDKTWK